MNYQNIIDKTYEVVNEIKETDEYQELIVLKDKINDVLKDLIEKFKTSEEKYVEALKYGNYHPDLKKLQSELSKAKAELFSHELVVKYKELEKVIEGNINKVVDDVAKTISNKIRTSSWLKRV